MADAKTKEMLEDIEEQLEEGETLETDDEAEETPKGIRPPDLAKEIGIDPKRLRGWLRKEYPRATDEKNTSWYLTDDQVEAAWARFAPEDDDEVEADETAEVEEV